MRPFAFETMEEVVRDCPLELFGCFSKQGGIEVGLRVKVISVDLFLLYFNFP